jgi:lipoprotein NlpD
MKTFATRSLVVLVMALMLAACGSSRVVKREGSRAAAPSRAVAAVPRDGAYVVRTGDTLYGIAFRHGLDYREVADINRIPAPYTIYPGQRLRLSSGLVAPAPAPRSVARNPARNTSRGSASGMPAPTPLARPGASPVTSSSSGPATVTALPPEGRPANAAPQSANPAPVPATTPAGAPAIAGTPVVVPGGPVVPATVSAGGWRWPTQGQLIGRFSAGDPKRQGIDIAGTAGQSVVAAADGVVVYSGAGLVGYGELIIVKHSDEWLSAYAHSRKRLVTEGTPVRAGQPIAELGRSGTSRDMLHFEVRRNGKPVDPLTVLPAP